MTTYYVSTQNTGENTPEDNERYAKALEKAFKADDLDVDVEITDDGTLYQEPELERIANYVWNHVDY